jgi:Arc/MetJ-type ribon-helix-helix transcriptional regulator
MKEKPALIRLPEIQLIILDNIVKHSQGRYKSRNDLVKEIIQNFIEGLKRQAEKQVHTSDGQRV